MTGLGWVAVGLCLLVLAGLGLQTFGRDRWRRRMQALQATLEASRVRGRLPAEHPPNRYDARELEQLPACVQRYFRAVLKDGQPVITAIAFKTVGRFNMSATGDQWKPFAAQQRVITRRPGFVWDACISMLPGIAVRVVDGYIAGRGRLQAAIEGLFTVAEMEGPGEIARGEYMRWFAEAAWYPTALLPSQGVQWEAVDAESAKATRVDGSLSLTLLFRFNDAGLIGSFRAEARGGMVGGKMVMAPWEGIWSNYQLCQGVMVPFTGEVAWMRPQGRRPYFIGTVTALKFEFAP